MAVQRFARAGGIGKTYCGIGETGLECTDRQCLQEWAGLYTRIGQALY